MSILMRWSASRRANAKLTMLTDTTFWIDLMEERRDDRIGPARSFIARHRAETLQVSVISWGELAAGFRSSSDLNALLHRVRIVYLHLQVAWEAGSIERELGSRGGRLGENDNWIAATARAWGLTLVTRDAAFRRVPKLKVI